MDKRIAEYFKKAAAEVQATFEDASDIRLEEFDKSRSEIVVSFLVPKPLTPMQKSILELGSLVNDVQPRERVYKSVEFDADENVKKIAIFNQ